MILLQSMDGSWHVLGVEFVPVSLFSYARDLSTVRNDGEDSVYLLGDGLVVPEWIEFVAHRVFASGSALDAYLAPLQEALHNVVKLEYEGVTTYLNFGYAFATARSHQLDVDITIRLAPVISHFETGSPITWGSVDVFLGQTDVLLGD